MIGFRLPLDAVRLVRRERAVRRAAIVPLVLSIASLALGVAVTVAWSGTLWSLAIGWLPWPEAGAWWSWLWVGPARALASAIGLIAFVALAGAVVVVGFLVGGVAGAPFLDRLSRRVEETLSGSAVDVSAPGVIGFARGALRSAFEEAKRLGFFLVLQAMIAIPGFLVPGLQPPAAAAMMALTILYLALDSSSYALDRRGLRFADKLRWSRRHLPVVAGYGLAAFALCSIPVVNLLALPLLVVAGTLLVVETERAG